MDRYVAEKLVPLVNNLDAMALIDIYVAHRIQHLLKDLETSELVRVDKIQGKIEELRRFATLRDEVQGKAK